jgi:hypothetical protein
MGRRSVFPAFLLTAVFLAARSGLWGQDESPYSISWEAVPGAGGYRIEMRNERNESVTTRVLRDVTLAYDFRLAPGKYKFRLTTLNRFMRDEASTPWLPIVIAAAGAPEIEDVQPRSFATGQSQIIAIRGRHFSKSISALLVDPDGGHSELRALDSAGGTLRLEVPPLERAGDYGLVLSNGEGQSATAPGSLRVVGPSIVSSPGAGAAASAKPDAVPVARSAPPPESPIVQAPPAEPAPSVEAADAPSARPSREGYRPFAIAAAWEYEVPVGRWASVFSKTPLALDLGADYFFSPHRRPKRGSGFDYGAGIRLNAADFDKSEAGLAAKSMTAFAATAHPLLSCSWPFMEASLYPGFGLSYANLSADGDEGSDRKSTFDFVFEGCLRIQFSLTDRFGLGADFGYRHYFFTQALAVFDGALCLVLNLPASGGR